MTTVDWVVIGLVAVAALWGYGQGLIVGALSLAGLAGGAVAGARLAPVLLPQGSESPFAPLLALAGALALGSLAAVVLEGVGGVVRARLGVGVLALADGVGGALLAGALGLGIAWIGSTVALQTPVARELRKEIQRSTILAKLNDVLPPSGPILNLLARFDPFPSITGPAPNVPAPNRAILARPGVKQAAPSVVRVLGSACGLGVQGSGWVAAPHLIVTNAHVVAGQRDTTVQPDGTGPRLAARAVLFDVRNDVAVLRVPGLERPALGLNARADVGSQAAILGYPENGPFNASAARLGKTATVLSQDAYGRGPVQRRMTGLRGRIRHGNSGGPAVDGRGRVVATVFAARQSDPPSGFGVPDTIVWRDLERATHPVDTGPCVS